MNLLSFSKRFFYLPALVFLILAFAADVSAAGKERQMNECKTVILANEEFLPALLNAIDEARDEIIMSVFSFKAGVHQNSYPDRIAGHLAKAVKRGVKVFVVLENTGDRSDALNIQNRKAGKLLEGKGIRVYYDSPRKTTHTKLTVIDQRLIFLGSHNFTQSALKYNNEISVLVDGRDMARNVRNYILGIIKEGT